MDIIVRQTPLNGRHCHVSWTQANFTRLAVANLSHGGHLSLKEHRNLTIVDKASTSLWKGRHLSKADTSLRQRAGPKGVRLKKS